MEVKLVTHLCRICLSDSTLIPIFDNISTIKICDKIMACAAVNIEIGDPLPTHICQQCHKALEVSYLFKTRCEQMDRQLRKIVDEQTVLLNQWNTSMKCPSVQISVEPSSESLFDNMLKISLPDEMTSASPVIGSHNYFTEEMEHLNGRTDPLYKLSSSSKNITTVNSDNSIETKEYSSNELQQPNSNEQELENNVDSNLFQDKNQPNEIVSSNSHADLENNSNDDIVMYFDNDDFHLGEECEVITDEIFQNNNENYVETNVKNSSNHQLPKGKFVIIKSVIKPQNIHYVNINNLQNKNSEETDRSAENCIKKEHIEFPNIKSEVPEPASYIETVTCETPVQDTDRFENPTRCTTPEDDKIYQTSPPPKEAKFKKRGRPKKLDKYKIPQGVSYLKSGRKNAPIFVRTRKTKRSRNLYVKESDVSKSIGSSTSTLSANVYRKTLPIVKRARVEKIILPRKFDDKKTEPNRKLSTNLLLSDKHLNKLNDPQKQVLYQRLKLQSFRPTSKKDIFERGIPKSVHLVSSKLSEDDTSDEDESGSIGKRKINRDLTVIQSNKKIKLRNSKLETIDQDLKLINGSSYLNTPLHIQNNKFFENPFIKNENSENGEKSHETTPPKTGRHTAIKSKRPQKRNHINTDNGSNTEKIEIELKMIPRKSERQRSPKKIFPEIDIFASPKRKVIEIPISENSSHNDELADYEIAKSDYRHNKFKIRIRGKCESLSKTIDDDLPLSEESVDLKYEENSIINDDCYNEIEVETETETERDKRNNLQTESPNHGGENEKNESDNRKLEAIQQILDKKRVQLDYGAGLTCNVCNKSFPYRSHLIRHVRTHTGLKPYSCEHCKKNFTSLSSLNIHVKNHIGDHPYSCEVCGRGFVQPSVLKRHMLSHTGEHPFQCELCYKTFVHDSSLKTHLKMHTIKEPQHKCDICEKKFKYLSTLTSHLKTHSGIKPFTCPECRKAFYRRSLLTRHMRSHTKERPYKCKLCKARFAYSGGLASHKKLHTGIRPFECEICDFTFFRISHLKNHMQKIHNNGVLITCQRCNMNFDSKPLYKRHLSLHVKKDEQSLSVQVVNDDDDDDDDNDNGTTSST